MPRRSISTVESFNLLRRPLFSTAGFHKGNAGRNRNLLNMPDLKSFCSVKLFQDRSKTDHKSFVHLSISCIFVVHFDLLEGWCRLSRDNHKYTRLILDYFWF